MPAKVDLNIIYIVYTFCESQAVRLMKCKAVYLNSKQCKRPAASCALTFVKKRESKFVYKPEFILFKLTNRLHRCVRVLWRARDDIIATRKFRHGKTNFTFNPHIERTVCVRRTANHSERSVGVTWLPRKALWVMLFFTRVAKITGC